MKKILSLLVFTITSCSLPEQKGSDHVTKKYFDLDSLMQSQIEQLESLNPPVNKSITIGGKEEEKTVKNVDWNNELSVFLNSDINKPKLLDQYKVEETINGNQILFSYDFIKKGATGVQKMLITKDRSAGHIQSVVIESLERNAIFSSHKNIDLTFKDNQLTSYSMKGFDKVAMRDTMWYDVKGVLGY